MRDSRRHEGKKATVRAYGFARYPDWVRNNLWVLFLVRQRAARDRQVGSGSFDWIPRDNVGCDLERITPGAKI